MVLLAPSIPLSTSIALHFFLQIEDGSAKSARKAARKVVRKAAKKAKKAAEEAVAGSDNAEEEQVPATTKPNKGSKDGKRSIMMGEVITIVNSEVELTDDDNKNAFET